VALPTIDWGSRIINIPKSYLTLVSGSVYEMNVDTFRLDLKGLEDSEAGMMFPDTHKHTTATVLAGVTYARFVEIINGYTITFEDGQYAVNLFGANNNIPDAVNVNQVSVRLSNSAGLISVSTGSGVTEQDKTDIISGVWNAMVASHSTAGSTGKALADAGTGGIDIPALVEDIRIAALNAGTNDYARPTGTVQPGSNTITTFNTDRVDSMDDLWKDCLLLFTSGFLKDQVKKIISYNSSTHYITVQGGFTIAPSSGDTFIILNY
jgi:hypothetical protein